jgi:hypothetical protein
MKFLQIVCRQVLARHHHQRQICDQHDRSEISYRIVKWSLIERLADGVRADVAEHELISVRRRLGDPGGANHAAGPADVLDDHLLPQGIAQSRLQNARNRVHRTTSRERHHHR